MTATWRVATFVPGIYTFEMQADNVGTFYMDGEKLGSTQPYAGHNRFTVFNFQTANLEPQIHEIKVEIENYVHRDGTVRPFETLKTSCTLAWPSITSTNSAFLFFPSLSSTNSRKL